MNFLVVRGWLLGVELDDELLAHGYVDLGAGGQLAHRDLESAFGGWEPRRCLTVECVDVVANHDHRAGLVAQGDDVALAEGVARDRDALAVHGDMTVTDELA